MPWVVMHVRGGSRLAYHSHWSAREWRNGRRAGLRIRCPKGRGSSTLPSRTPSLTCGSSFQSPSYRLAERPVLLTLAHGTEAMARISKPSSYGTQALPRGSSGALQLP
jgi:hypothetical protein